MLRKVLTSIEECSRCYALSYDLYPEVTFRFEETVKHDLEFKMFYIHTLVQCALELTNF